MSLHEKSLRTLELPVILDMLAAEAVNKVAKEAALSLRCFFSSHPAILTHSASPYDGVSRLNL